MWKIIEVDNFDRETKDDKLLVAGIRNEAKGKAIEAALQAIVEDAYDDRWYRLVPHDYVLRKFNPNE